jgi:hypothetical protein
MELARIDRWGSGNAKYARNKRHERSQPTEGVTMKRPSAAIVISSAALFFSVTGAGFAAHHYLITSTSQIKPSVINSLRGHTGARGPAGTFNATNLHVIVAPQVFLGLFGSGNEVQATTATCPSGTSIVSGGYTSNIVLGDVSFTGPNGNGWAAVGVNDSSTQSPYIQAIAVCAG